MTLSPCLTRPNQQKLYFTKSPFGPTLFTQGPVIFYRDKLPKLHEGMAVELNLKAYNGATSNRTFANCSVHLWVDKEKNTFLSFFVHFLDNGWRHHSIMFYHKCLTSNPIVSFETELDSILKGSCNCEALPTPIF